MNHITFTSLWGVTPEETGTVTAPLSRIQSVTVIPNGANGEIQVEGTGHVINASNEDCIRVRDALTKWLDES